MNSLPTISVVTPTLNQRAYIEATIDSVLAQDYPGLEYLIIDGGSTDGTLEVLASYGKHLSWISEADTGQAAAINKGWQRSNGEIVAWLNSDDLYLPGAIQQVGTFFSTHPEVDVLYGDCEMIDESGRFLRNYLTKPFDLLEFVRKTENYLPQPATFIRRHVLQNCGLLDEGLVYTMDFDYWLRVGLKHSFAYLNLPFAQLRVHATAKSITGLGRLAGELVQVFQRFFSTENLPPTLKNVEREAMANMYHRACGLLLLGWRFSRSPELPAPISTIPPLATKKPVVLDLCRRYWLSF